MNREIILDLNGWRKNIFISQKDYERGDILIPITYPLLATLPRDEIPIMQEYINVRFIKNGYNENGVTIFKFNRVP